MRIEYMLDRLGNVAAIAAMCAVLLPINAFCTAYDRLFLRGAGTP